MDIDAIRDVVTLGNLNPPGHVFPSDHGGFYIDKPGRDPNEPVTLYSPGNLRLFRVGATELVTSGTTEYVIALRPCEDITVVFGHVKSLSTDLFGDTSSFDGWRELGPTGPGNDRNWSKEFAITVSAGEALGTIGGRPEWYSFDFFLYDQRVRAENIANPERWVTSPAVYAVCYLRYFEKGPVLDQLVALVQRDKVEGEDLPCDTVVQDILGTAKGAWYLEGVSGNYPEDPHLGLLHWNTHPAQRVFSIGNSIPNIGSGVYAFLPVAEGLLNRDFADIVPDGQIYGFQVNLSGAIIIQMPDSETLWVEALTEATADPSSWAFTENKTIFVR